MRKFLIALVAGLFVGATALAMSGTAEARWGYGWGHPGWGYGGSGGWWGWGGWRVYPDAYPYTPYPYYGSYPYYGLYPYYGYGTTGYGNDCCW
jgi:hypothetical protein